MSANHRLTRPGPDTRSEAQRQGNAAMGQVMKGWEALPDEERLAWDVQASHRRTKGINERPSKGLRSNTLTIRRRHAPAARRHPAKA